ncbi:signal peptidase I [Algoriphagus resistens]|uniref:signal peptidase I n=1 Tax=Algoriphagus resistens TaxID=1750590 RepID=UPI0007167A21|nr:signal peptidase I [Algoriphagus resistens]
MNTNPTSKKSKLIEWRNALVFAVVVATLFRWSLAEAYVIPTGSMENSLLVGDYILVSKVHYGPRTPQTPIQVPLTHQKIWGTEIPSYLDWIQLPSYRLPGLRNVERGETVVFNTPKDLLDPKDRPGDLMTFLVKRCVAVSGDILEIRDRNIFINGEQMTNPPGMKFQYDVVTNYPLQPQHLTHVGLDRDDFWISGHTKENRTVYSMFLTDEQAKKMQKAPDVVSLEPGSGSPVGFPLFPAAMDNSWDLNNYGPLMVPQKGTNIQINETTLDFYGELIQKYEGNRHVKLADGKLEIDGKGVDKYTFKEDYYFMMGDSRDNSIDSRYWGFVPESHIVGKPLMVLFSKNEHGEGLDKVRWGRIFSKIK